MRAGCAVVLLPSPALVAVDCCWGVREEQQQGSVQSVQKLGVAGSRQVGSAHYCDVAVGWWQDVNFGLASLRPLAPAWSLVKPSISPHAQSPRLKLKTYQN